ncbi:MAG: alanine--tRNA ligase-related protein, partial [Verrucomicrobiota bacterium]
AYELWAEKFRAAGLDPAVHIINGNKKDNFWMMGETGPCGPCSELHMDLTPAGDTRGALVNKGSAECIEIWNLVFIQFNANPDGSFTPLPAQHVDTGMGFERVASIIQGTKGFSNFANANISNYETDIFRPIFDEIETLSGKAYGSTLPAAGSTGESEQEKADVAFRVIADHIRTLSFAIADGIQPGNTDRNYVLRRILRRAVKYGRTLGFHEPFFYKLVDVLARNMGDVFPEIRTKQKHIEEVLKREEEAFNRTLDKGIELFEGEAEKLLGSARDPRAVFGDPPETSSAPAEGALYSKRRLPHFERPWGKYAVSFSTFERQPLSDPERDIVLDCLEFPQQQGKYLLYVACVMPDHVHLLFEPQVKETDAGGNSVFYSLTELLQSIKSVSAHRINKLRGSEGSVWEKESFERLIRSESDLREKFSYICRNPWEAKVVGDGQGYPWLWTLERGSDATHLDGDPSGGSPDGARGSRALPGISGAFAFRLYDEQGFPLDLTELMARERGLAVDVAGFEKLMNEQRVRARAAQKKQVIELSEVETKDPTKFVGYDLLSTPAKVLEVVSLKDKTAVVLDASAAYA